MDGQWDIYIGERNILTQSRWQGLPSKAFSRGEERRAEGEGKKALESLSFHTCFSFPSPLSPLSGAITANMPPSRRGRRTTHTHNT